MCFNKKYNACFFFVLFVALFISPYRLLSLFAFKTDVCLSNFPSLIHLSGGFEMLALLHIPKQAVTLQSFK